MDNKQYLAKEYAKNRDEWKSADAGGRYRKSGIIYWNHQPGKNYLAANGAGDSDMKTDILMSELAKLIVGEKTRVVELLNQCGVQTSSAISSNALSEKVGKALYSNVKFAEAIAAEIVQSGSTLSADGTKKKKKTFKELLGMGEKALDSGKGIVNAATSVKDALGNLFGGKNKNSGQAQSSTDALKENVDAVKKINGAGLGAAGYVLIALGASALIGGVYYFVKHR